jgi:hypothetical protein
VSKPLDTVLDEFARCENALRVMTARAMTASRDLATLRTPSGEAEGSLDEATLRAHWQREHPGSAPRASHLRALRSVAMLAASHGRHEERGRADRAEREAAGLRDRLDAIRCNMVAAGGEARLWAEQLRGLTAEHPAGGEEG